MPDEDEVDGVLLVSEIGEMMDDGPVVEAELSVKLDEAVVLTKGPPELYGKVVGKPGGGK